MGLVPKRDTFFQDVCVLWFFQKLNVSVVISVPWGVRGPLRRASSGNPTGSSLGLLLGPSLWALLAPGRLWVPFLGPWPRKYYNNLYITERQNITGYIQCGGVILEYDTFKDKITRDRHK